MTKGKSSKKSDSGARAASLIETQTGKDDKPYVLTIAGFDDTAGAGLLADIKTFNLFGLYGLGVPTAVTVQTPDAVLELSRANAGQMRKSLETMLQSFKVSGIKSGLLCDEVAIDVLYNVMKLHFRGVFVVDPIQFSSGGRQVLNAQERLAMAKKLFPLADVITPNLDEAELVAGVRIKTRTDIQRCAARLHELGPKAVIIKGSGRLGGEDYLFDGEKGCFIPAQTELASSLSMPSVHGTGCFHSASLLSLLVRRMSTLEAAKKAKYITEKAILTSTVIDGFKSRLIDHCAVRPFASECV